MAAEPKGWPHADPEPWTGDPDDTVRPQPVTPAVPGEAESDPETPGETLPSVDASRAQPSAHGKPGALPSATLEQATDTVLAALSRWYREIAPQSVQDYPSRGFIHFMLEEAAPVITAGERERAEALQHQYDACWRALWIMVRQFGGSVFLTASQLDEVPPMATLGYGREPAGLRVNAEEEP